MPALRSLAGATAVGGHYAGKPRGRATLADLGIRPAAENWQQDGHCRDTDPEAFFPVNDNPNLLTNRTAYQVCATCPVRAECADFATRHHLVGIWGGTSTHQRRLRRRRTHQQREEAA
ncbi:WhiB family transcriptional regulator [Prauserella alba]|uniref:Transcriptional regulator WhiB n=1 Tax=Prauserella alba TaxID=176898 RepID=A0ABN1VIT0_9PSEU|nr:WhiB family transcriptional regulator [Prauserella alba]MCP2180038.1 WhiB family transcriptional regulator, redox-sensing transcriptional regulator [Prauserella alba]